MGTKQTKGCQPGSTGESPPAHHRKKTSPRERGDFLASLVAKSGEKFGKGARGKKSHRINQQEAETHICPLLHL